jgi:hypothetical protein
VREAYRWYPSSTSVSLVPCISPCLLRLGVSLPVGVAINVYASSIMFKQQGGFKTCLRGSWEFGALARGREHATSGESDPPSLLRADTIGRRVCGSLA